MLETKDFNEILDANKFDKDDLCKPMVKVPLANNVLACGIGMEKRRMNVTIDPDTGENKLLGEEVDKEEKTFESVVEAVNNGELSFSDDPVDKEEINSALEEGVTDLNKSIMEDISDEDLEVLLDIINLKMSNGGEKIESMYKRMPQRIQNTIDNYINGMFGTKGELSLISLLGTEANSIKNDVANALLAEFINKINIRRSKHDFAKELEEIFNSSSSEISESSLEYSDERNKAYREAVKDIEDESKREKVNQILDRIEEARNLSNLKEFAKKCKIKPIELEKPESRIFGGFMNKYKNSSNNIYNINLSRKVLYRHLSQDGYSQNDVDAFLIAFCKQVIPYKVDDPLDHAYMYYLLYYCTMLDGDKSDTFKNNVKEVIEYLRERNDILRRKNNYGSEKS